MSSDHSNGTAGDSVAMLPTDRESRRPGLAPTEIEEWSRAVVSLLRASVIAIYFAFATWVLVSHGSPMALAPLLAWALGRRDGKAGKGGP
jgi:hypothetical protein